MAADDYSSADLAMGADLADAVNLAATGDPADCLAVVWPAGDYDDEDGPKLRAADQAAIYEDELERLRHPVDVAVLLRDAVTTDGAHHKQWYLEQLAAALRVALPDHAPGIAP